MYAPNLAGLGPGFDSKSEQPNSITIQTDPRQRTSCLVPIRWLVPHTSYLTLCVWHALRDTGVTDYQRSFEKSSEAPFIAKNFFWKFARSRLPT